MVHKHISNVMYITLSQHTYTYLLHCKNAFHTSSKGLAPKEMSTLLSGNTVIPWKTYLSPSGLFSLCTEFHDSFPDTFISVAWSALTAICVCACVYKLAMKEFRNALMTTPVFLSLCCSVSGLSIPCRLIWCHGLRWHFKYTPEFDGHFVQGFEHEAFQRAIIHSTLDSERFYQSFWENGLCGLACTCSDSPSIWCIKLYLLEKELFL